MPLYSRVSTDKANPVALFILGTCYSQRIQPTPLLGVFLCRYDKGGWDGTGKGFIGGDAQFPAG